MFLSLLELNPRSAQVRAELRDLYQMHRTLSRAFGDDSEKYKDARCLFRVDESDDGTTLRALVQSQMRPDWDAGIVAKNYLIREPQVKEFAPAIKAGQRLRFRLRANPTVKRDGKRIGMYTEQERRDWLQRKAAMSGFRVLEATITSDGKQTSRTADGLETVFSAALFNGEIEVTDEEKFIETLRKGVGSAKGFGFGLISIAPYR